MAEDDSFIDFGQNEIRHNIEEEFQAVNFIVSQRIYDVLLGILHHFDPEKADYVEEQHKAGKFIGPAPVIRVEKPDE